METKKQLQLELANLREAYDIAMVVNNELRAENQRLREGILRIR